MTTRNQTTGMGGSGHCCACSGVCYHVGGISLCELHRDIAARRAAIVPVAPYMPAPTPSPGYRVALGGVPCPASVEAVLGFPEPVTIPCGLAEGHVGRHSFSIEWSDGAA